MLIELGEIEAIFRYPVKSMSGERLDGAELGWHGIQGDRRLAFRRTEDRTGFPWLTAGRLPDLVRFSPVRGPGRNEELPTHVRTPEGAELDLFGHEHAEQAVRWAKFHPRGERGMNGGNRDGRFGLTPLAEYSSKCNAETFLGVQIETASAIASVAEIAAVPDVDLLFVGPADISQVLGVPGDFENPRCLETIERIARACADAGKPWGIVPRGAEYAARMVGWGCRMFVLGLDIHVMHAGVRAFKERYASFFEAG